MLGVGEELKDFNIVGVKPKFENFEENGESAFEVIDRNSFQKKWKVIYFYPKDFTFICPTEIAEYAELNQEFLDRDCIVLGGSTDNEHCKLAWRREHPDLSKLNQWSFADTQGTLVDEGTWGTTAKRIVAFHNLDISGQPSGTSVCYKITTHNQSGSKSTYIHAASHGWK